MYKIAVISTDKNLFAQFESIMASHNDEIVYFSADEIDRDRLKLSFFDFSFFKLEFNDHMNLHMIKYIKRQLKLPLYVFGKDHDEEQVVKYLNAGAEGYINIPFSSASLYARVSQILKYIKHLVKKQNQVVKYGPYIIDMINHHIKHQSDIIRLTNVEYRILSILFENKNEVVSKDEIIQYVWDNDISATDNALGIHIARLRKKLFHEHEHALIQTVWGTGYRLNFNVCEVLVF